MSFGIRDHVAQVRALLEEAAERTRRTLRAWRWSLAGAREALR